MHTFADALFPDWRDKELKPVPRCRITHCWHGAVEEGMCLGHLAEAYEHASHGCPDGICEVCESTAEPIA